MVSFGMRFLCTAAALACLGCAEAPGPREQALVARVEKHVQLPKGAGALRCYKRYYAVIRGKQLEELLGGSDPPVRELLVGHYREPGERREDAPGIRWVDRIEDIPTIHDAGCSDLQVWYAEGWPEKDIKAGCAPDFAGSIPEEIKGKPLTC